MFVETDPPSATEPEAGVTFSEKSKEGATRMVIVNATVVRRAMTETTRRSSSMTVRARGDLKRVRKPDRVFERRVRARISRINVRIRERTRGVPSPTCGAGPPKRTRAARLQMKNRLAVGRSRRNRQLIRPGENKSSRLRKD
jgi:hypothetical protein